MRIPRLHACRSRYTLNPFLSRLCERRHSVARLWGKTLTPRFLRCVQRDPSKRFTDAGACWAALEPVLKALPARTPSAVPNGRVASRPPATTTAPQALQTPIRSQRPRSKAGLLPLRLSFLLGVPVTLIGMVGAGVVIQRHWAASAVSQPVSQARARPASAASRMVSGSPAASSSGAIAASSSAAAAASVAVPKPVPPKGWCGSNPVPSRWAWG